MATSLVLHSLISPQLAAVETLFGQELASELPHVNNLVNHVSKFRGKMLRPMLVLISGLAAKESGTDLTHDHVVVATSRSR